MIPDRPSPPSPPPPPSKICLLCKKPIASSDPVCPPCMEKAKTARLEVLIEKAAVESLGHMAPLVMKKDITVEWAARCAWDMGTAFGTEAIKRMDPNKR